MKKCVLFFAFSFVLITNTQSSELSNFLEKKSFPSKVKDYITQQDINFSTDLGDLELAEGLSLSSRYKYNVESSYMENFYSRIDKWDVKVGLDVGDILKDTIDVPLSFSVNRNTSFLFVRQFKDKKEAIKALPYTPKKLPLNAELALKNLEAGDFVSMPANLNIAVKAETSTTTAAPIVIDANANVFWIVSGEFTVQVFKIDSTHVRLKLISKRSQNRGVSGGISTNFEFFGIKLLDNQIDRLFDRHLLELGLSYTPGAQFVVDYVFNLKDPEARLAYNQILSTTFKFKDIVILDQLGNGKDLKDKLISSYEKADKIFQEDIRLEPKDRRVSRVFKGFTNYKGHSRRLKMGFLMASYKKDRTYTSSNVTFVDKNEVDLKFFYPTYSKYMETKVGRWFFEYKDQSFQNNFGLIPKAKKDGPQSVEPDFGLTFERKDKLFSKTEQKAVRKFMANELPLEAFKGLDLSEWGTDSVKIDARINFQIILKSQGFSYLRKYSQDELFDRLTKYIDGKKQELSLDEEDDKVLDTDEEANNFAILGLFNKHSVKNLSSKLYTILKNSNGDTQDMTNKLVKLNEFGLFGKVGVGFLISLLPANQLEDLIYANITLIAHDIKPVKFEYGKTNYAPLYRELNALQSRLSNRSYDLRLSTDDQTLEDSEMAFDFN